MDTVSDMIDCATRSLKMVFDDGLDVPPVGGGTDKVRFLYGDGVPLSAWTAHSAGEGCDHPMLWVRLVQRFRSESFPTPSLSPAPCGAPRGVQIELGVARCDITDPEPSWTQLESMAEISLDDSWRIETALCATRNCAVKGNHASGGAMDAVLPVGPEGGVSAWVGSVWLQV